VPAGVAHRRVAHHVLELHSRADHGSTFVVTLPRDEDLAGARTKV
jgi:hypothetical protein